MPGAILSERKNVSPQDGTTTLLACALPGQLGLADRGLPDRDLISRIHGDQGWLDVLVADLAGDRRIAGIKIIPPHLRCDSFRTKQHHTPRTARRRPR